MTKSRNKQVISKLEAMIRGGVKVISAGAPTVHNLYRGGTKCNISTFARDIKLNGRVGCEEDAAT